MKTRYLLLAGGLVVLALVLGVIITQQTTAEGAEKKAINFILKDTNGKDVKLSAYRGKVVVVDVWATWCSYCVKEIPDLVQLQAEAKKKKQPLQMIGITVDTDKSAVERSMKEYKFNYPILYAEKGAMKPFGQIYGLPTKFIINKKGEIVDKIIGAIEKADLEKRLAAHLK